MAMRALKAAWFHKWIKDLRLFFNGNQKLRPRRFRIDPECSPATVEREVIRSEEEGLIEFNDCLGEPVAYRGYVHIVIHRVNNRNDPYEFQHYLVNSIMSFDGIGVASGARYDIRGLDNVQVQSENADGLPTTATWVLKTPMQCNSAVYGWHFTAQAEQRLAAHLST